MHDVADTFYMGELVDLSDVVNRCTGGNSGSPQNIFFYKNSRVSGAAAAAPVAGRWTSLWQYEGFPTHGSAPTTWVNPTNTTDGGLMQTDPSGGRELWMLSFGAIPTTTQGSLLLYDRLGHNGNLDGTATAAQTFTGTINRYTSGIGNQIWVEIYTQIGSVATTATISYTDQDGNSATTPAFDIGGTNLREAQRMIPVPLAAGDYGVQAVANIDLVASTTGVGAFGVSIIHPLALIELPSNGVGNLRDLVFGLPNLQRIETDACLSLAFIPNSASAAECYGNVVMIEA